MIRFGKNKTSTHPADGEEWDQAVGALNGDLLQCWLWGEFKSRQGWLVERVRSSNGSLAQILFRNFGPISLGYIPRGPVFGSDDPDDHADLLERIDRACAQRTTVSLIVDPATPLPGSWLRNGPGFENSQQSIQSPRTVHIDLKLSDDELLAQMRKDTRYNIRYAERNGTVIEEAGASQKTIDDFFSLLGESSTRREFGIHDRSYYHEFLNVFGKNAKLLFARTNGNLSAGLITSVHGREARSMYAGMRPTKQSRGDAALLRFTAMQLARANGCSLYDLGGIAPVDPAEIDANPNHSRAAAVRGLEGVERFKVGFGGTIVHYPPALERMYRPNLARIGRRLMRFAPGQPD